MIALALLAAAAAQDALTLSAVTSAQEGLGTPSVTFSPRVSGSLEVSLSCGAVPFSWSGGIRPGQPVVLELSGLPRGAHDCQGAITLRADDGSEGQMPLSLAVEVLPPLSLSVDRSELDLEGRRMTLRADRALSRYELEVLGEGGAVIGRGGGELMGLSDPELTWEQTGAEALKIDITAWDTRQLAGRLELSPWSYNIPHEDVIFETGSDVITAAEAPKMEAAWAELQGVLARYGDVVEVRLYVAGYTDTVGDPASNQALSERRARSIAAWFRARGFAGQVSYQGFGESVLAVGTEDEVDEPRNRRALYILAAEAPPTGGELPRGDWRPL